MCVYIYLILTSRDTNHVHVMRYQTCSKLTMKKPEHLSKNRPVSSW